MPKRFRYLTKKQRRCLDRDYYKLHWEVTGTYEYDWARGIRRVLEQYGLRVNIHTSSSSFTKYLEISDDKAEIKITARIGNHSTSHGNVRPDFEIGRFPGADFTTWRAFVSHIINLRDRKKVNGENSENKNP